jgi:hypothetical protein
MMNKSVVMMLALICATPAVLAGEVYKWKDAQGHVHYGDQPTHGAQKIEVNAPASQLQLQREHDKELSTGAKTAKRFEDCKRSKEQLTTYQSAANIISKDGFGGEKELNTGERTKLIQMTQQKVKDSCDAS